MPRPSKLDFQKAVSIIAAEAKEALAKDDCQFVALRPKSTGPNSIKKKFGCGTAVAEEIHEAALKILVEAGFTQSTMGRQMVLLRSNQEAQQSTENGNRLPPRNSTHESMSTGLRDAGAVLSTPKKRADEVSGDRVAEARQLNDVPLNGGKGARKMRAASTDIGNAEAVGTNSIVFADHEYAVLDGTAPANSEYGYQESWLELPDGWEFAPSDPAVVSEVIRKHPWGTEWLICGDGRCYSTSKGSSCRDAGPLSSFKKITQKRGTYRPALNSSMDLNAFRILIRRCLSQVDDSLGTPPKKSRRNHEIGFRMCPEVEQHTKYVKLLQRFI